MRICTAERPLYERPVFGRDGQQGDYMVVCVMALPQRGHCAAEPAQAVPQEEQVEQPVQLWP